MTDIPCEASKATTRGTPSFTTSALVKPLLTSAESACSAGGDGGVEGGGVEGGRGSMQTHPVDEPSPQFPAPFVYQLARLPYTLHAEGLAKLPAMS